MSVSVPKETERIWYKDPKDFFTNINNIAKFIPDPKMTYIEQLNAAYRFSLYFSLAVLIVKRDVRVLFFAVFVAIFTYVLSFYDEQQHVVKEKLTEKLNVRIDRRKNACSLPTKDNPYMNVLMSDYKEFPTRPKACNINNKDVKKAMTEYGSESIYQDMDDVFNRKAGDRQFYTTPVTTIPNSQNEFAHWLYNTGTTCKEKSIMCTPRH